MLKVCHIISGDLWAGPEVQLADLLPSLSREDFLDLKVILLNQTKLAEELISKGVSVTVIPENKNTFLKIFLKARKEIQDFKPDILHSHRYKENLLAFLLSINSKSILVQSVHGLVELHSGFNSLKLKAFHFVDKILRKKVFKLILPVSKDIKIQLDEYLDNTKSMVLLNAIDVKKASSDSSVCLREKYSIPKSNFLYLFIGRLVPVKGVELILEAMKKVSQDSNDSNLLIVGDGPELEYLKDLSKKLNIDERVIFAGFLSNPKEALKAADAFLMSSIHEGIPVALLEAMLFKKPVISTNVGGIPEVAKDKESAILLDDRNSVSYSTAMLKLKNNKSHALKMGETGCQIILDKFSIEAQKTKLIALYEQVSKG